MTQAEPFAAVLPPDPTQLHTLRDGIARWLGEAGVDDEVRDAVVLATHEAAASAMGSPGDVFVDATHGVDAITVAVSSADGWTSPDDDLGGRRMSVVRKLVDEVSFERGSDGPRLRFEKPLLR